MSDGVVAFLQVGWGSGQDDMESPNIHKVCFIDWDLWEMRLEFVKSALCSRPAYLLLIII